MAMKIFYIGNLNQKTTSRHRADALSRLGYEVILADPYDVFSSKLQGRLSGVFHYRTGYRFIQSFVGKWLTQTLHKHKNINLVWVDSGELLGRDAVASLKALNVPVVLFNHDDPTGSCYGQRFASLKQAFPLYDLVTAVRDDTEKELRKLCKGKVLRIWRTYDEIQHSPKLLIQPVPANYLSDVSFIGTWFRNENRDVFLLHLINRGLDVAIWGSRWEKSPHWHQLKKHWRGNALSGRDYVTAISSAKICIGMVANISRDLHTTRSMEIPFAGGLFCAKRTLEHEWLYAEDIEAVFWSTADECADKCLDLLDNPEKRERIRLAGMQRVRKNKVGNEDICRQIISEILP